MKLLDRIRIEGLSPMFPTEDAQESAARLTEELRSTTPVVILAENVADYFYQQSGEGQLAQLMTAANAAPPFEAFWIEWSQRDKDGVRRKVGCFFTLAGSRDADACSSLWETFNLTDEQTVWMLRCEVVDATRQKIRGPVGIFTIPVGGDGSLPWENKNPEALWAGDALPIHRRAPSEGKLAGQLSNRHIVDLAEQIPLEVRSHEVHDKILTLLQGARELEEALPDVLERYAAGCLVYVFCSLLTVTFMHCKNVELVERQAPAKLARAYRKRRGVEPTRWHVLKIDPMRKVLRTEGGMDQGNSLAKALHICRGHFATYAPERPLFGRPQSGPVTVWKPMHVKGRRDRGQDQHDYEVKAPSS